MISLSLHLSVVRLVSELLFLFSHFSLSNLFFNPLLCVCVTLSQEYQSSSVLGQFVTRFMLRETSSQLLSLQRSLQCAMEAVEEQSSPAPLVLFMTVCFVLSDVCCALFDIMSMF